MPIKGARYRFRKVEGGYQRLAFKDGDAVEVTNYSGRKGSLKKGETKKLKKCAKKHKRLGRS